MRRFGWVIFWVALSTAVLCVVLAVFNGLAHRWVWFGVNIACVVVDGVTAWSMWDTLHGLGRFGLFKDGKRLVNEHAEDDAT